MAKVVSIRQEMGVTRVRQAYPPIMANGEAGATRGAMPSMRFCHVLFCVLSLAGAVGCRMDRYELTEPIDCTTFEVKSGDRISVVLEENATTGYIWMTECDDADISFAREYIPPDDPTLCGAPGKVRIIIRVHRGFDETAHVRLVNRRPWEGGGTARVIDLILHRKPEDDAPWR